MPEFEFTTEYTEKTIIQYCSRHLLSKKGFLIVFFTVVPAGILATSLFLAFAGYNQPISFLLIMFIALGVMVPLSWYYIPRRTVKSQQDLIGAKQNYKFFADKICITSIPRPDNQPEKPEKTTEIAYADFTTVLEAKDALYFYATKNEAYILDTTSLSTAEVSALKAFIHDKFESKKIKNI